jgi:hypothetical protein
MPTIVHFTDYTNLEGILEAGVLRCPRDAPTTTNVGNLEIKDNRTRRVVTCDPGGVVCDYVPFYFAPRSPMLFSIKCGNVLDVDPNQARLVYLVSSTEKMYDAGLDCVFSDGNAAVYISEFDNDAGNLATHVDWAIMEERMWRNTSEDGDRVRRRMAEFLVHQEVPIELFTEIGVKTMRMKTALDEALADDWPIAVRVRPSWYF